jgi:hypothetical protein
VLELDTTFHMNRRTGRLSRILERGEQQQQQQQQQLNCYRSGYSLLPLQQQQQWKLMRRQQVVQLCCGSGGSSSVTAPALNRVVRNSAAGATAARPNVAQGVMPALVVQHVAR